MAERSDTQSEIPYKFLKKQLEETNELLKIYAH